MPFSPPTGGAPPPDIWQAILGMMQGAPGSEANAPPGQGGAPPPGTMPPTSAPPSSSGLPPVTWGGSTFNDPKYPYALWGGTDNVAAQKPPDWLAKIVADALAMPDGPEKTARIQHILSGTTGPDYITNYLNSAFGSGAGSGTSPGNQP